MTKKLFIKMTSSLLLSVLLCSFSVQASIKVAVASNFKTTLMEIAADYEQQTGQQILISSASTGILYHQIQQGAPFDLFLSADLKRAKLTEDSNKGVKGSRFTYAQGRIALWMPQSLEPVNLSSLQKFRGRVAIANPKLAPYGLAAEQALTHLNLLTQFSYVQGANISQTYQFVDSGNVEAGFVAYSLLLEHQADHFVLIPAGYYQPILQQGVLLSGSTQTREVQDFMNYLTSEKTQKVIRSKGYL
ncbi:molybdate ABC transporter substrate-binding protein [Psychromonas sp.]|uniref:molybdate ABC transporter substrate-binding protein n=1 Tax=Psychromonas sp. TaxID=1884585 RepID=UPI0039E51EA9